MTSPTESPQAVVEAYVTGTKTRDVALLRQVFHESAVMSGYLGPDLLCGGPEPFYGALEANEVGPDYSHEIVSVITDDSIATAELHEANLLGLSFTNHFHMARQIDGTWRIVSKLFRHS